MVIGTSTRVNQNGLFSVAPRVKTAIIETQMIKSQMAGGTRYSQGSDALLVEIDGLIQRIDIDGRHRGAIGLCGCCRITPQGFVEPLRTIPGFGEASGIGTSVVGADGNRFFDQQRTALVIAGSR